MGRAREYRGRELELDLESIGIASQKNSPVSLSSSNAHVVVSARPVQRRFRRKSRDIYRVHFTSPLVRPSTVVIRRHLRHQERELFGHVDAGKPLLGEIDGAVGEREDNFDDVAGAAKLGMAISITS
jgi:hypothetical protein